MEKCVFDKSKQRTQTNLSIEEETKFHSSGKQIRRKNITKKTNKCRSTLTEWKIKKMDIQTEEDCESGNDWEKKRLTK